MLARHRALGGDSASLDPTRAPEVAGALARSPAQKFAKSFLDGTLLWNWRWWIFMSLHSIHFQVAGDCLSPLRLAVVTALHNICIHNLRIKDYDGTVNCISQGLVSHCGVFTYMCNVKELVFVLCQL